ncbi:MAG: hypothetical protein KGL62_16215 [Bradyrhizobium sp.]|uniref:hypothetical protein n=1 Tax=Bradyrhizobium sp. TaxID=376 RepID=UPI0023A5EAFD|nr:hypothetical protein [Bradyrhizobium sp.]MDE2603896.1 hypothetical protein [Bradyrhizobium sp.]
MIAMVGKGISHPKLPLRQTIRLSYSSYFEHFRDGLRISAFWLAIAAMFDAAMGWMQATWMAHIVEDPRAGPDLTPPVEMTVLDNIGSVVVVFACVSIAVAWHRLLLLEERPGRSGGNLATSALWLYASAAIVICLLAAIPFLALLLATWAFDWAPASSEAIEPQTPFLIAAAIAAYATGAAILLRLCLLLPACAIGDLTLTITGAWRRSRGNSWRLFWGIVACIGPTAVIVGVVFLIMVSIVTGHVRTNALQHFAPPISAVSLSPGTVLLTFWIQVRIAFAVRKCRAGIFRFGSQVWYISIARP